MKPLAAIAFGHVLASVDVDSVSFTRQSFAFLFQRKLLPQASKIIRAHGSTLLLALADNKKPMRDAVIAALQMSVTGPSGVAAALSALSASDATPVASLTPADPILIGVLVPIIPEALVTLTIGRHELLVWLLAQTGSLRSDHGCSELVSPLIVCLQDKTAAVRSTADQLLLYLMTRSLATKTALDRATRDLPQATRRSMQGSIDRLMNAHGTGSADAGTSVHSAPSSVAPAEPSVPVVTTSSGVAVAPVAAVSVPTVVEPVVAAKKKVSVQANPGEAEEPQIATTDQAEAGVKGIFRKTSKVRFRC